MTNRTVLERARSHERPAAGDLTATPDAADEDERRWRPTVWFNPWMYQTGEQVWAGLAHEIITQVTERMPRAERERFWLELNVRRVDEQAVRRRIYALVLERVLPWALGGLLAVIAGLGLLAVDAAVGAGLIALGPGGVAVLAATQLRRVLAAPPSGVLAELVAPADRADDQLARLREPDRRLLPAPGRPPAGARPRRHAAAAADRVRRRPRPLLARHGRAGDRGDQPVPRRAVPELHLRDRDGARHGGRPRRGRLREPRAAARAARRRVRARAGGSWRRSCSCR